MMIDLPRSFLYGLLCLIAAASAGAETDEAPLFAIRPVLEYWRASAAGTLLITKGSRPGTGTDIHLRRDLDCDVAQIGRARLDVIFGNHRIAGVYEPLTAHGTATLDGPIVFRGTTYPAGERVSSEIGLTLAGARYDYRLAGDGWGARIGGGADVWRADATLKDESPLLLEESRSFSHVLPVGTLTVERRWGLLRLGAAIAGGMLPSGTDRWEAEASAGAALAPGAALAMGYRISRFDLHAATNRVGPAFHGPFVSFALSF